MEAESATRPRVWLQFAIGAGVVGALALIIALVPTWIVKRATRSTSRCLDNLDAMGDPESCSPRWLAIARLAPHTRAKARKATDDVATWIAARHRQRAERPGVTAAMRAQAIAAIRRSPDPPDERASELMRIGAFEEAATIDIGTAWFDVHAPLASALVLGDIARARQLVKQGVRSDVWVGAAACLLGDSQRGLEILGHEARRARLVRSPSPARVAGHLCGATSETFAGEDPFVASDDGSYHASMFVRAYDPAFQAGRRRTLAAWLQRESYNAAVEIGAAALALAAGELTPIELYHWLPSRVHDMTRADVVAQSPWMVVRSPSYIKKAENHDEEDNDHGFVPPGWLQAAAARVADGLSKPPPVNDDVRDSVVAKDPHLRLRAGLTRLYATTAVYALRGAKREIAREAVGKLRDVAPASLDLAVLQGALGEHASVLETLGRWEVENKELLEREPHDTLPQRRFVHVNRVLAMLALGDLAGAHAAALAGDLRDRPARWLALATTIVAKKPLASLSLSAGDPDEVHAWLDALQRGTELPRSYDFDADVPWPAVLIVIGHAATLAGGDVEKFLDSQMSEDLMRSRTMMRARAESARWRGDATSAKKWDERANAIEALVVDDRTAALAEIAGMW